MPKLWVSQLESSKQSTLANSMIKSQYIAFSNATKEVVWIEMFVIELSMVPSIKNPIELYWDNNEVIM